MDSDELKPQPATEHPTTLSEPELLMAMDRIRSRQNLGLAIVAGLLAMTAGAAIWAAATISTGYQIGWLAIIVGVLVGMAVRIAGNGIDRVFGITAALLSLLGCALGNLLTVAYFVAQAEGVPYFELLFELDLDRALQMLIANFNPMDLLFYLFAVYFGYRYAIREVTDVELQQALHEGYGTSP